MSELGEGRGSSYPEEIDTNTALERDKLTWARAAVPNDLADAIVKIETELGTNPAGAAANVAALIGSWGLRIGNLETDLDGFPDELKNLVAAEIQQLENIGTNIISASIWGQIANIGATAITAAQWVYLGAMDQGLATTDDLTFATLTLTGAGPAPPVANRLYIDNIVKAWIQFNGTGVIAIQDSFNVDDIVDNGMGDYTVVWDLDFANNDYASAGAVSGGAFWYLSSVTGGTLGIITVTHAGSVEDFAVINVIAIGDQ